MYPATSLCLQVLVVSAIIAVTHSLPNLGLERHLMRRQTDVPSQCESSCGPVLTLIDNSECTLAECCTVAFETNLTTCFECVGNLSGTTNFTTPQQTVDSIIEQCAEGGFSLPAFTFPGQSSTGTASRSTAFASSTIASGSPPASTSTFHQITITSLPSSSAGTFTQSTVTALSSSALSTPASASTTLPQPSASVVNNAAVGSPGYEKPWVAVIVGVAWAAALSA